MWRLVTLLLLVLSAVSMANGPQSGYEFQSADIRRLQDDSFMNPGMLWVDKGKQLFETPPDPTARSCSSCHVAGSLDAQSFPRESTHERTLFNLTTQIQHCRVDHQDAPPLAYESEDALALTAYLASLDRGQPIASVDPALDAYVARGRAYYKRRKGQLNLACFQCHDQNVGKMLRGDLLSQGQANGYPIYRLEWQSLGSLHRRLRACDIGVRAEPYPLGSETYISLELFLKTRAQGLLVETPAVRR
ncbi:MAG: sulfur oxidation c-type cytochrome SoxA [Pseudomonadota bacterium]